MRREIREKRCEEIAEALENFNGNPDTEKALRAVIKYLNLDISIETDNRGKS